MHVVMSCPRLRDSRRLIASSVLVLALMLAAAGVPREARAQGLALELGGFAGWHAFNKESELGRFWDGEDTAKSFLVLGPRVGLALNRWVTVEAEGGFIPTKTRNASISTLVLSWRAHLLLHPLPDAKLKPFLLAGGGGLSSLSSGNTRLFRKDTDGGPHLGVGVKMPLSKRVGIRLDGRALLFPSIARGDEELNYEALLGVYLRLGGGEPAPARPAPAAAPAAEVDPDSDGIVGAADKCPSEAEDKDEFEDADGCPDPDNDKDGVSDAKDKCPLVAGLEAAAGCPDKDKDGVPDADDKCPAEPETDNSYQDEDGCPDKVPEKLQKFTGTIEGITFETNSDVIKPTSFKVLDRAAAVLVEFKTAKLSIEGHTDNVGTRQHNVDLSTRRAAAVKKYLTGKGVPEDNLQTKGLGPDKPVAGNKTAASRAKNRRVEFVLVD
jgi:outer membrane protein OmpA-like peptidoglycan-associated protein